MKFAYRYIDNIVYTSPGYTEIPSCFCNRYLIVKETPKGYWVEVVGKKNKFCLNDSRRKWAYRTEKEALESYIIRKRRQIQHATRTLAGAQIQLVRALKQLDTM